MPRQGSGGSNPLTFHSLTLVLLCLCMIPCHSAAAPAAASTAAGQAPPLVLQITVDALRGDLPGRYQDRFVAGGFRYLLEQGTVYADARHAHANTETIVGHTTLATGAHPATHGMIGNVWFDQESGRTTYNIEDDRYRLLSRDAGVDERTEIDPTQKAARSEGRSPAAILVTTYSDQLSLATAGRARIFGISVKDRGAVSMAGHAGKAFWFSKASGEFVTSTFYGDAYPPWVTGWNQRRAALAYAGKSWELLRPLESYLYAAADDQPWEKDLAGFGRTFPHPYGDSGNRYLTTLLTTSPAGDALTLDFARTLVEAEALGQDAITDYLSVSLSSTDYVHHLFGPSSLEAEDQILRLDRLLAEFFAFLDERIGLHRMVVVLAADHGAPDAPGVMRQHGVASGYVRPAEWDQTPALAALKEKFGVAQELIIGYDHPYVSLNRDVLAARGLDQEAVEVAVAEQLARFPGVATAVPSTRLRRGGLADTELNRSVLLNFHPQRSGDIFVVFSAHHFINEFDGLAVASSHGMPWTYDQHVPILFAGAGIPAQVIHRRVHTVDVAPTLAALTGTLPPSGSAGRVLHEVMPSAPARATPPAPLQRP